MGGAALMNLMQLLDIAVLSDERAAIEQEDSALLQLALPGNLRSAQVEAALRASGYTPSMLYFRASAGEPFPESFREALYGPQKAVQQ
jgi:hypothetical protein